MLRQHVLSLTPFTRFCFLIFTRYRLDDERQKLSSSCLVCGYEIRSNGLVPNLVKVTSDTTSDKPCNGSVCSNFSPNSFVPNFPLMACGRIFLLFISEERWKNSLTASVRPSKATILTHQLTSSFLVISMKGKPSPVDL